MSVDDLVEAYLAGQQPTVPAELREEFERAILAHKALAHAIGETVPSTRGPGPLAQGRLGLGDTVVASERASEERGAPSLPEDYEIVRELGRGGMGVVYLARQRSLGRMVAVKVLRPGEIAFGPFVKRFVEEARHLARLRHPNIVSIHETGQAGDEPYFTMDYVEGESLHAMLKRGPLSPTQAVRILKQAAEGVEHAHAQGIIHRDLKPANILLDKAGRAYVTDFGLARDITRKSDLTGSGDILGTPAYMAPEQANGDTSRIGEATDVHALGVILYEMLTGQAPYGHANPVQVLVKLLQQEPVAPRRLDRRIPRDLETICLKAMAKAPEARYATVHAFLKDLRRFEGGEPILARGPSRLRHVARFLRLRWKPAAAVLAAIAVTSAFVVTLAHRHFGTLQFVDKWNMAETLHGMGDHAGAVRSYDSLYASAPPEKKEEVLAQMVRCAGELGENEDALDAWQRVLSIAPDRSFGASDGAVALLLARDLTQRYTFFRDAYKAAPKECERAAKRLRMYVEGGTGRDPYLQEAKGDLELIDAAIHPPELTPTDVSGIGGPAKWADDNDEATWMQGTGAEHLGEALERKGDKEGALARYRQAWSMLTSEHPSYSPPEYTVRSAEGVLSNDLGQELRDLQTSLQRMDPLAPDRLRGGIVLRFGGSGLPKGMIPRVTFALRAVPDALWAKRNRRMHAETEVAFGADGSVRIGVADGKYQLLLGEADPTCESEAAKRAAPLLVLDEEGSRKRDYGKSNGQWEDVPGDSRGDPFLRSGEIEVNGDWVEVAPVRFRWIEEIHPSTPTEGARIDLRKEVFHWSEVKGATRYEVGLDVATENRSKSSESWGYQSTSETVPSPYLCLGEVKIDEGNSWWAKLLVSGRALKWSVKAFDAKGRVLGTTCVDRHAFIEHGIEEQK